MHGEGLLGGDLGVPPLLTRLEAPSVAVPLPAGSSVPALPRVRHRGAGAGFASPRTLRQPPLCSALASASSELSRVICGW